MERKWVVVAFGDLTGFGSWAHRAANAPEIKEPFLTDFYSTMQYFVKTKMDATLKYMGDGFMIVRECSTMKSRNEEVSEFLNHVFYLTRRIQSNISKCADLELKGFRTRMNAGYVYKIMVLDPHDPRRERMIPEYVEYTINTCQKLLEVNPEINCLATDFFIKALGKKRASFWMRKLEKPSCYPKGVNLEDIDSLKIINLRGLR